VSKISAADSAEHPYVESKDLKTETCLTCHPAKNQGKFVHTAIAMGCENCHVAASKDNQTSITLRATGGNLCAKCHVINTEAVQHGPYKAGQCLICHDPHTGDYPAQTRAAVSTLCLGCHMLNQPDAKVNFLTKIVTLLDWRVYDLALWQSAPKINDRHGKNQISPGSCDVNKDKGSEKHDAEPNCLTCHDPHASKSQHLLHGTADTNGLTHSRWLECATSIMHARNELQDVSKFQGTSLGGRS
jgi:predicted CXXCH cytochrome family protein